MKTIEIRPIGMAVHPLGRATNAELRKHRSRILVDPRLVEALDGIEEYSHIVVVFWMDRVSEDRRRWLKAKASYAPPDLPPRGVLATRIPERPNPIGISTVALIERCGNILVVEGLDAFSGTPILDIKPFTGHVLEDVRNFRFPEWERPTPRRRS